MNLNAHKAYNHHPTYSQQYWGVVTSYVIKVSLPVSLNQKLSRGLWVLWVNTPVLWRVWSHTTTLPAPKTRQDKALCVLRAYPRLTATVLLVFFLFRLNLWALITQEPIELEMSCFHRKFCLITSFSFAAINLGNKGREFFHDAWLMTWKGSVLQILAIMIQYLWLMHHFAADHFHIYSHSIQ